MSWMEDYLKERAVYKRGERVETDNKLKVYLGKLDKLEQTSSVVNLKKSVENCSNVMVNLKKEKNFNMFQHKARVAVVLDYSGSMRMMYNDGTVQRVLERLLPIGLQCDDNGVADVWIFEDKFSRIVPLTLNNMDDYVKREIVSKYVFGGTDYYPVIADLYKKYFDDEPDNTPIFVIFMTDGDTCNKERIKRIIKEKSGENLFLNFVGLGTDRMSFLEKLDDLRGRKYDNTAFFRVENIARISDDVLYRNLFSQYIDWIQARHG